MNIYSYCNRWQHPLIHKFLIIFSSIQIIEAIISDDYFLLFSLILSELIYAPDFKYTCDNQLMVQKRANNHFGVRMWANLYICSYLSRGVGVAVSIESGKNRRYFTIEKRLTCGMKYRKCLAYPLFLLCCSNY